MLSVSILVKGHVQGVAYRYSTLSKAKALELSGFVKNQTDGSVYIEASGNAQAVHSLELWCNKGPSRARVEDVQIEEIDKLHSGEFIIR